MSDSSSRFQDLVDVMDRLRSSEGCPWDREQTHETLIPYIIEEAYEVIEAIEERDFQHLREELGDLLYQIVFQARLAQEKDRFEMRDVVDCIVRKMTSRHPHVFGDSDLSSSEAVRTNWEQAKRERRRDINHDASILDGVPSGMPALVHAARVTEKASRAGFDWTSVQDVMEKLQEELRELDEAIEQGNHEALEHELGDVLFTVVNASRFLNVDAEQALRQANRRFTARFKDIERSLLAEGLRPEDVGSDELDRRWTLAKDGKL